VKCDIHSNREATEVCFLCKKRICSECTCQVLDKQGKTFQLCRQCNGRVETRLNQRKQTKESKLTYFIPAILILAGFAFLISSFVPASLASPLIVVGVLIIVLGLPAYFYLNRTRKKSRQ
jgi:Flp pilus assembly protein TadB